MNAKIEREAEYWGTIGKHSLHEKTNENGTMLIDFTTSKSMIISTTWSPHKSIHKATWISADGTY